MNIVRRSTYALFLSAVFALPALGEKIVATKLPDKTFRELMAVPAPPLMARENRHDRRVVPALNVEGRRTVRTEAERVGPRVITNGEAIGAPPVALSFNADASEAVSPADASGAAGRTHVVGASNAGIVVYTRAGAQVGAVTLSQFWRNENTVAQVYDPRLTYDAKADRWVTAAIYDERALLLAVSTSGDPMGGWTRYSLTIECDFTRLALTRDTILLSTIDISTERDVLFSFSKQELYAAAATPAVRDYTLSGAWMPVDAPDSPIEYVVKSGDSEIGVSRLDRLQDGVRLFHAGVTWEYPFNTLAPQAGTTNQLDLGYGDIQAAMLRNGWLYVVHRVGVSPLTPDGNALLWWKVDPDGQKQSQLGVIDLVNDVLVAYPSLAVNRTGAMLISFCVLAETGYPSSGYVYFDAAGRRSNVGKIRDGDSPVLNTDRWGDYTTVTTDPLNDSDFWVAQIHASRNRWQSTWSQVKVPAAKGRAVRK